MQMRTRGFNVGALVDSNTGTKLDTELMQPLLEQHHQLLLQVNAASVFADRSYLNQQVAGLSETVNSLITRLATLDIADVNTWKADVQVASGQMNAFLQKLAVYSESRNHAALYSAFVGVAAGALASVIVYRRKKAKKWVVFAGAGAAAVGGFSTWAFARPTFG